MNSSTDAAVDPLDRFIAALNSTDVGVAQAALEHYEPFLRMVVRRHLGNALSIEARHHGRRPIDLGRLPGAASRNRWQFQNATQLRAFLARVARNRLIDHQRKHRRAIENDRPLDSIPPAEQPHDRPQSQRGRPGRDSGTACSRSAPHPIARSSASGSKAEQSPRLPIVADFTREAFAGSSTSLPKPCEFMIPKRFPPSDETASMPLHQAHAPRSSIARPVPQTGWIEGQLAAVAAARNRGRRQCSGIAHRPSSRVGTTRARFASSTRISACAENRARPS